MISTKIIILIDGSNMDHNNLQHGLNNEANNRLSIAEAANMRRMPNLAPTWKSYGLHMSFKNQNIDCNGLRTHKTSCTGNAYVSVNGNANLKVFEDFSHRPLSIEDRYQKL